MSSEASRALASDAFAPEHLERVLLHVEQDGRFVEGEWEPGNTRAKPVQAVTAPLSGQQRDTLPEGLRQTKSRAFWLPVSEVSSVRAGETDGDEITHDGTRYRVVSAKDWGAFIEALAVKPEAVPT